MRPHCAPALTAAVLLSLAACAPDPATAPDDAATASASALTVTNARVVLAAVAGNPAAVYFDLSYSGAPGISLTNVTLEGAGMTMIHDYAQKDGKTQMTMAGPVMLSEGKLVSFAPGGLHVMAVEPSDMLKAGGTAKITFTLSDGTTATIDAPVRAAGDAR